MIALRTPQKAAELNAACACRTLDRGALAAAMARESGDPAFVDALLAERPHLLSDAPTFLSRADAEAMAATARAVEAAMRLPAFRAASLERAGALAGIDHGTQGAFAGFDFHVGPEGSRLIEINTNAGGAWLNALAGRAHRACCPDIEPYLDGAGPDDFDAAVVAMFEEEWRRQRGADRLRRIAIVDDDPTSQYLYPEFVLARKIFERAGYDAMIVDAKTLDYAGGRLLVAGAPIDLVYNRLVDFALAQPEHAALAAALADGAATITPAPRHHALYADKRNLALLSDAARLRDWGLGDDHIASLELLPNAQIVDAESAPALWAARRGLFFKPASGYGSKAVYRGDKLTRGVWGSILAADYIAQEYAAPGERLIAAEGGARPLKLDVRLYAYSGRPLLFAARLYQGQTTNFRTPGGGFAPVFIL